MQRLRAIAAWAGTAVAVWLAFSLATGAHSLAAVVLALACAAVASPPARRIVRPPAATWLAAAVLASVAFVVGGNDAAKYAERERAAAARESAERAQMARAARQTDFTRRKVEILREIASKAEAGQYREAMTQASSYGTSDPDLANLQRTIEAAMLKQEAASPMTPDRGAVVFARLAELEPSNAGYREQAQTSAATAGRLHAALDRLRGGHCPAVDHDYEATRDTFVRERQTDPALVRRLDSEGPFVGLSEALFLAFFCPFVEDVNETQTATGTRRQYVMRRHVAGRYVYTQAGIVTAVQR